MDSIVERRSIRKYKDTEVSKDQIREIVEAAVKAPSAKNRQPWKFIAYSGETKNEFLNTMEAGLNKVSGAPQLPPDFKRLLSDAYNTLKIMRQAPALIAVVNTNGISPFENITTDRRIMEICDTLSIGAAVENMILKATEIGLGTLWIANTFYAYEELSDFIGEDGQLACAVALGYADETPDPRPRKPFEDILEFRDECLGKTTFDHNRRFFMKSILIKDTTREEREQIIRSSLDCGGGCENCSSCWLGGGNPMDIYQDYIDGKREIREINQSYMEEYRQDRQIKG